MDLEKKKKKKNQLQLKAKSIQSKEILKLSKIINKQVL